MVDGPPCCACGCGRPTKAYSQSYPARGIVKGEYARYLHGHNREVRLKSAEERFWEKVEIRGADECWPWTAATRGMGHGVFWLGGRNVVASRYAYELVNGGVDDETSVLHHCDNPPCCNPRHLFTGTQADNMADMVKKGRSLKHEDHSQAKLTEAEVGEIRRRRDSGELLRVLAADFGVTEANISSVARGMTWR